MTKRGFTLVEVLASLTIAALIAVSIVSSTRGMATAREKADWRVERSLAARHAMDAVVGSLRNVRNDPVQRFPVVVGTSGGKGAANDRIDLLVLSDSPSRPDGAESDQQEVSFYLVQRGNGIFPSLVCRRDHALDEFPQEGGVATVIAEGIVGFSFAYYDGEWFDAWSQDQTRTPKAVRVTIEAASTSQAARRQTTSGNVEVLRLSSVVPLRAGKAGTVIQPEQPREQRPEGERPR